MGLDHSKAFVRVFFDGLIAFCFTKSKGGRAEMGMVQAEKDHMPLLTIIRVNPNGTQTVIESRALGLTDNITIDALNPVENGVSKFRASGFDNVKDEGDPEDFRWIVDLQGDDFHKEKLKLKKGSGISLLRPRITIPDGIFYNVEKTPEIYRRITRGRPGTKAIGKIANAVGCDIVCSHEDEGGRVEVTIGSEDPFILSRDTDEGKGFRYHIWITNLCRQDKGRTACSDESDFRLYYQVAVDDDGIKYDLEVLYMKGDRRGTTPVEDSPGFKDFFRNGPPQVCNSIFLSQTNSIP
jgi:hypothetical protein